LYFSTYKEILKRIEKTSHQCYLYINCLGEYKIGKINFLCQALVVEKHFVWLFQINTYKFTIANWLRI